MKADQGQYNFVKVVEVLSNNRIAALKKLQIQNLQIFFFIKNGKQFYSLIYSHHGQPFGQNGPLPLSLEDIKSIQKRIFGNCQSGAEQQWLEKTFGFASSPFPSPKGLIQMPVWFLSTLPN